MKRVSNSFVLSINKMNTPDKDTTSRISLGLNLAAGMIFFTYGGYFIDQKRGGGQFWTLIGICLGFLYCGYEIWKLLRQINK